MTEHFVHPMYKRAQRALRLCGDFYTVEDLVEGAQEGRYQSFVKGDSWVVTQIAHYPRKDVMEVILAIGSREDLTDIEKAMVAICREHELSEMVAIGRDGWRRKPMPGWKARNTCVYKEI